LKEKNKPWIRGFALRFAACFTPWLPSVAAFAAGLMREMLNENNLTRSILNDLTALTTHRSRSQINFADVLTEIVNPKKGPKSCVAGMLVMNKPGTEVSK